MRTVEQQLGQWQQELLDLTNRNRLLNFRPSTSRPISLQLTAPDLSGIYQGLIDGKGFRITGDDRLDSPDEADDQEHLTISSQVSMGLAPLPTVEAKERRASASAISAGVPLSPGPGTAISTIGSERTNRVAQRLHVRARASEQEQGVNTLFAIFGLLKWQEKAGEATWRYAPLVMLPLRLEEYARDGAFRIVSAGDDPEFNQTLVEKLRRDFGILVNGELEEETTLSTSFQEVRAAVTRQLGWEVVEQMHVGLFQFYKLRMFTDLTEHLDIASNHDIIRALALENATIAATPEAFLGEDELDRVVSPDQSFAVLDADASQLRAIQAATRGAHLVIQGPPGTGKSQTIANIVAESIAAGKSVLFVSEKAAAIEVVYRRLSSRGLGDLSLMLHSQKASKRDVIYDLASRMEPDGVSTPTPEDELGLQRLQEIRTRLNAYANALHREREGLRSSAFSIHAELAALQDVPLLAVPPPPDLDLTRERLDQMAEQVGQLAHYASVLDEGTAHPWFGVHHRQLGLGERESLRQNLVSLRKVLDELIAQGADLAKALALSAPTSLTDVRILTRIAGGVRITERPRSTWLDPNRIAHARSLAEEAKTHAGELEKLRQRVLGTYGGGVLKLATPEAISSFERGAFARFFSVAYRGHRSQMRSAARDGQQRPVEEELSTLRDIREIRAHEGWFRQRDSELFGELGLRLDENGSFNAADWTRVASGVAGAAAILTHFPDGPPPSFINKMSEHAVRDLIGPIQDRLGEALDRFDHEARKTRTFFVDSMSGLDDASSGRQTLSVLHRQIDARLARFEDLEVWLRAHGILDRVDSYGLRDIVEHLRRERIQPASWSSVLRRLLLTHWLDGVYRDDANLRTFHGEEHEAAIQRFRDLDHHYLDESARRVRQALAARQVRITTFHGGEPGLLRYEAQKRKRHLPLRRLFERIPNLLQTLKPCLMMSPLSVAQFLPAHLYRFDVVIFDEASQVRPHDAIGAIIRGRQLVVAGDTKQLPPTSFFDRAADSDEVDGDQDIGALESILDALLVKGMVPLELLWHYRSRHEDLIAYSNHHFYGRRLITFPSPVADRSTTKGVRLEFVPSGRYEDATDKVLRTSIKVNREEARHVAKLVLAHARDRPEESLIVVTLGMNQRDVIEDEIKQARLLDPLVDDFFRDDSPDPFYVKALEQVQGDERDVIMISVGYGKNAQGHLSHNFGPINQDGGERRLNVLVTRARHQVILVSSIKAGDIDLMRTQKLGPRLLKNYLDFAERGPIALEAETTGGDGDYESPFEEEVGEALRRAGIQVRRQVGTSKFRIDLAVVDPKHPGRYILGIECDGKTYHQSKTARDRDRLRQEILEGLGWRIHRIWSTEWLRNPARELDRLIGRIDELLSAPDLDSSDPSREAPNATELVAARAGAIPEGPPQDEQTPSALAQTGLSDPPEMALEATSVSFALQPYAIANLEGIHEGELLSVSLTSLVDAVVACADVEGPIHHDLLVRRVVTGWGYHRSGSRLTARVDQALSVAIGQGRIRQDRQFVWASGFAVLAPRGSTVDGIVRDIQHIPAEEIALVMRLLLEQAFSLSKEQLIAQTARLLGYQRTGRDIERCLQAVLSQTLATGQVEIIADRYRIVPKPG